MARKKKLSPIVPLAIQSHAGEASPHLLDLRSSHHAGAAPAPENDIRTFEETLANFDDRLKDMPDLLKARAKRFSLTWQESFDNLLERSGAFARTMQDRLKHGPTLTRRRRKAVTPLLPLLTRAPQFLFIVVLVVFITIPLQAIFLYRAIHQTQHSLQTNLTQAQTNFLALGTTLENKNFQALPADLSNLLSNLRALRVTLDRLGPLRLLLPDRLKTGYALLQFSERAVVTAAQLALQTQELVYGRTSPLSIINTLPQELDALRASLRQKRLHSTFPALAAEAEQWLDRAYDLSSVVSALAGSKEPRYILLLFQNPRELRATGGFAGSFALLTVREGKIEAVETPEGGTYAIQGQLSQRLIGPEPLRLINPRFEFQDANWWPNFPTSAAKIADLFQAAGGPTIDAVIAITATVGEELLRLHGPLKTPEGELTAVNFIDTLQETIARDRVTDHKTPKKIITNLLPAMVELTKANFLEHTREFTATALELLAKKDVQIWAREENNQAAIKRLGWAGELTDWSGDYLAVITSNIGGGKTDGVVKEEIEHQARILSTGAIQKQVRVKRTHTGERGNPRSGLRNIAYLRVYVPLGARLIQAQGNNAPPAFVFETPTVSLTPDPEVRQAEAQPRNPLNGVETWQEKGKTVLGLWLVTDPGQTAEATLTLEMSATETNRLIPYALVIERQAGKTATLKSAVQFDEALRPLTAQGSGKWDASGFTFEGPLTQNMLVSSMLYRL